jgi:CheY-like chemotaxis protein
MTQKEVTILVVDDEPLLVEIFSDWLEQEGYKTATAENGARGLELATKSHFDLIVSDVRMPVMTGIEMARQVSKRCKYIPKIIFISGFSDISVREYFDVGVECLLTKPSRRSEFLAAVRRSLTPRGELWRIAPASIATRPLDAGFTSLAEGRRQRRIALGRGGFCIRSNLLAQATQDVRFRLEFSIDQQVLAGQGVVRWADQNISEIGVEITYVEDGCRDWIVELSQRDDIRQFIPMQCDDQMR